MTFYAKLVLIKAITSDFFSEKSSVDVVEGFLLFLELLTAGFIVVGLDLSERRKLHLELSTFQVVEHLQGWNRVHKAQFLFLKTQGLKNLVKVAWTTFVRAQSQVNIIDLYVCSVVI